MDRQDIAHQRYSLNQKRSTLKKPGKHHQSLKPPTSNTVGYLAPDKHSGIISLNSSKVQQKVQYVRDNEPTNDDICQVCHLDHLPMHAYCGCRQPYHQLCLRQRIVQHLINTRGNDANTFKCQKCSRQYHTTKIIKRNIKLRPWCNYLTVTLIAILLCTLIALLIYFGVYWGSFDAQQRILMLIAILVILFLGVILLQCFNRNTLDLTWELQGHQETNENTQKDQSMIAQHVIEYTKLYMSDNKQDLPINH